MQLLYRVEAEGDVAEARSWYERQRQGLGRMFQAALRRTEALLKERPTAFPVVHAEHRRAILHRFPYAVYYRPLDESRLEVVAVLHQRQDRRVVEARTRDV